MASVMCLHFSIQDKDLPKLHLCTLYSTYNPTCNIGLHFITLLKILMPKILVSALECQVS